MYPPLPPDIMHTLQSWSGIEAKITRQNIPELSNATLKDSESSAKSSTGLRTEHSLAKERETEKQAGNNKKKHIQQAAKETVFLATKVKDSRTLEQKY